MEMSDYKIANNIFLRFLLIIIDKFSKYAWCIPLKIENAQVILDECSNTLTTSKRTPNFIERDRGREFYYAIF